MRERRELTVSRHIGETLVLAPFPFAVANVEVDEDGVGQTLLPVGRDLQQEGRLQAKPQTQSRLTFLTVKVLSVSVKMNT